MPNHLRPIRERKRISQAELARMVGVSRQALSAIEINKQEPSLNLALKIAQALNAPLQKIFYPEEFEMLATKKASTLTDLERLNLVNQYQMLQAVHKDDDYLVKYYRRLQEIFERGYVHLYDEAFDSLSEELSKEISDEVLSILDMHRAMLWSLGQKPDPADVERVKFLGFDANNESRHLAFARFYTQDGDKYEELKVFNSHHPTLESYRKMLREWDRMDRNHQLSKVQIDSILEAGTFKH
jgi:uncharacterized protein